MSGSFCAQPDADFSVFGSSVGTSPCRTQYEAPLSAISFSGMAVGTSIYFLNLKVIADTFMEGIIGGAMGKFMKICVQNGNINSAKKCTGSWIQKKNAYFTVEAALILPVVLGTLLFIVYMLLFQYDRCLMEQDLGELALWGSRVEAEDSGELQNLIQKRAGGIYKDKYAVWKMLTLDVKLEHNRFGVTGKGQLAFPVPGINFWSRDNIWESEADYRFWRISPVDFVRLCNRVKTWQRTEDEEDAER